LAQPELWVRRWRAVSRRHSFVARQVAPISIFVEIAIFGQRARQIFVKGAVEVEPPLPLRERFMRDM